MIEVTEFEIILPIGATICSTTHKSCRIIFQWIKCFTIKKIKYDRLPNTCTTNTSISIYTNTEVYIISAAA